ncbi:MAG: hybrid sensor histidine kinase/response regulator, partial [Cyanobacteria bacterium J06629_18]
FIAGSCANIEEYLSDIFSLVKLQQEKLSDSEDEEIEDFIEEIDLEYLQEDLPKLMKSMHQGITRLKDISLSLRTFARSDIAHQVEYQIHEGLNSTLMLLKHRLKDIGSRPKIEVIKSYSEIPSITCYPGQLNQVFMNIVANAIDAFDDLHETCNEHLAALPYSIIITSSVDSTQKAVSISIEDNALGMTPEV